MTTFLAGRAVSQGFVREFFAFLRTIVLTGSSSGDETSTSFCWPRGL